MERNPFVNRSFLIYARIVRAFGKLLLHLLVEQKGFSPFPCTPDPLFPKDFNAAARNEMFSAQNEGAAKWTI